MFTKVERRLFVVMILVFLVVLSGLSRMAVAQATQQTKIGSFMVLHPVGSSRICIPNKVPCFEGGLKCASKPGNVVKCVAVRAS